MWQLSGARCRGFKFCSLLALLACLAVASEGAPWLTLTGQPPLIVARGGASNQYPDMTYPAYDLAIRSGATYIHCGLTMTSDKQGVCRPGLDIGNSTDIVQRRLLNRRRSNYTVDGRTLGGYFTVDYTLVEIKRLRALQPKQTRPGAFDARYALLTGAQALDLAIKRGVGLYLELLSPSFHLSQGANMTAYVLALLDRFHLTTPATSAGVYIASAEILALRLLKAGTDVPLIFKLEQSSTSSDPRQLGREPTTNQSYARFLTPGAGEGLREVRAFADGLLVPKELVLMRQPPGSDARQLSGNASTLIPAAHKEGLQVHVQTLANDDPGFPWLAGGDGAALHRAFFRPETATSLVANAAELARVWPNFTADAVLSDFPETAAIARDCELDYARLQRRDFAPLPKRVLIIGDASGELPAQTAASVDVAIQEDADVIQCFLQMTRDGVPICRESPDLSGSTDIFFALEGGNAVPSLEPALQGDPGFFAFDFSADFILDNLTAVQSDAERDPSFNGAFGVMSVREFFAAPLAYNRSVGLLLDLQFPTFYASKNLSVVDAALGLLDEIAAFYPQSNVIYIQSYEAGALQAMSERLANSTLSLVFVQRVDNLGPDPSNGKDYKYYVSEAGMRYISTYASVINLYKELLIPVNSYNGSDPVSFFLQQPSQSLVQRAHRLGLKMFVYKFQNEPSSLEWDFAGDPTVQLNFFVVSQRVDGVVTDFPQTASNFIINECYLLPPSQRAHNITPVIPGEYLKEAEGVPDQNIRPSPPPPLIFSPPPLLATPPPLSYFAPSLLPNPPPLAATVAPPPGTPLVPAVLPPATQPPPPGSSVADGSGSPAPKSAWAARRCHLVQVFVVIACLICGPSFVS